MSCRLNNAIQPNGAKSISTLNHLTSVKIGLVSAFPSSYKFSSSNSANDLQKGKVVLKLYLACYGVTQRAERNLLLNWFASVV